MRKLIPLMLFGFAYISFTSCKSNQKKDKDPVVDVTKSAEDKPVVAATQQTYFITAPDGWTHTDSLVAGVKQTKMFSPNDGPTDNFKENINVSSEAAAGYTSKSYGEANLDGVRSAMPGVEITDLGATTLGDLPAECYTYTFSYQGYDLKDIAWYVAKNDVGYVITCTALKSTFDRFEPTFKTCANTFRIK